MYSGSVAKIDGRGLRVRLSRGLYGTCKLEHLSDKQLKMPLGKYKIGQSVRCLVLESDPERGKLMLSLKLPVHHVPPRLPTEHDVTAPALSSPASAVPYRTARCLRAATCRELR